MPPSSEHEAFFARIQKECLPGVWSKGVALSRTDAIRIDSEKHGEMILRVMVRDRTVSPQVTLWPADDDAFCDCGDRNEICAHVAACVIALRAGQIQKVDAVAAPNSSSVLQYRWTRIDGGLRLDRFVMHAGKETLVTESLVSLVGGISSGRIPQAPIAATREDFAVDAALGSPSASAFSHSGYAGHSAHGGRAGALERSALHRVLPLLSRVSGISLDGEPVQVSSRPAGMRADLGDVPGGGFRFKGEMDPAIQEVFSNGAALCEGTPPVLRPLQLPLLNSSEQQAVSKQGRVFKTHKEIAWLVSELLPALEKKLPVEIRTEKLPSPRIGEPKISLRLVQLPQEGMLAVASLIYPETLGANEILIQDGAQENALMHKLRSDLHLSLGQAARFNGQEAVDFALKLQRLARDYVIQGEGGRNFGVARTLVPRFELGADGFEISFAAEGGNGVATSFGASSGAENSAAAYADPAQVLNAWRDQADFVPLHGGGWAPLPKDWLKRYGARVAALLEARSHGPKLPAHFVPELADLAQTLGCDVPEGMRKLRSQLETRQGIPAASLPADLRADLRSYQREGIDWLCWLRDGGMGALLADDMGLGKTLQALCAIQGKTLVVCPTSVLSAWSGQIAAFRPGLRVSIYHGAGRAIDEAADVTLTTYALLRLDRDELCAREWGTMILDEAQTIKNPTSQAARAAHALRGKFRIALSGTPVENRLDDLWSQFEFVNPGLLGTRAVFQDEFGQAIARGDTHAAERLRTRLKPFLLRRLKREVASELPSRTETVLHCELTESERELYDSIAAASKKEALQALESGGGVFAALEALLRLRQAACHGAMVPGSGLGLGDASSKLKLLLENLEESVALGHRALVFSQWTSFLDLIEPALTQSQLSYARLDGSTRDRESVVREFQAPGGPSVLLISLKAGGTGLTLTAADHVYILDPWWNPAVEDQAADRAHRIGQENPVLIQRLVARDSVEDRILALQARKKALASSVLDGAGAVATLTREDLVEVLA